MGDVLQAAVVRRRKVRMVYTDRSGQRTERLVDPLGLVDKDETWYLLAGTEKGQRTFRVDRIVDVAATELPAERPDGFDLSTAWEQVVDQVEERRSGGTATVLIAAKLLPVLRKQFGRQSEIVGPTGDGRIRVLLTAPLPVMIAQTLAGWGDLVEVEESGAVQAELARLGAELVARYASHDQPPH